MVSTSEQIRIGQVFSEKETGRNVVVTGFGVSQGDETTIKFNVLGEEQWGGEFSATIFQAKFIGPRTVQVG